VEAQPYEAALPEEDLGREFAAVLSRHDPFDNLHNHRAGAAVILKLLGAIVEIDLRATTDVLVVGALIGILETAPPAYVVHKDCAEVGMTALDVLYHLFQRLAAVDIQATSAVV
jgi:hypothetical protein